MEILGIGPLEFLLILVIALIVLGPNDMVKAGRMLGASLRRIITSPVWQTIQQASRDIRSLPTTLMRDAGVDEMQQEIKDSLPTNEEILVDTGYGALSKDVNNIQKNISGLPPAIPGIPSSSVPKGTQSSTPKPAKKDSGDWVTPIDPPAAEPPVPEQPASVEQDPSQQQVSSGVQAASASPDQLSSPEEPLQI